MYFGPHTVLLTMDLRFRRDLSAHEVEESIDRLEQKIRRAHQDIEHIFCHTPRDDNGDLVTSRYLEGAPIPVSQPPYPQMNWALKAPGIAGLIGYTKEEGVRLLTEGITRDGRVPNPPMPRFRFDREDAEAVVAYLKSLK